MEDLSEGRKLEKHYYYVNLSFKHQGSRFYAKWRSNEPMLGKARSASLSASFSPKISSE